jgi:hypothetical protein
VAARSDVEALSRSFRSRIFLLVLLLTLGLGAALWTGTRERGIGAPEDRQRIMVVTAGSEIDYEVLLEQAGFSAEVEDFDPWLATARTAAPDSEAEGVALLLEHADRQGFALVVFERPSEIDFDDLELEPALATIDRLAERDCVAVSVGDHAFPRRLTVDDPGEDPILRVPGYGALQAIFRQELIGARAVPERPTVEELQFEDATRIGREMFERPSMFDAAIATARASIETASNDGSGARMLIPALATGGAIPTPDGGILVFHHDLVIYSDDARSLDLDVGAQMQLSWIGPAAVTEGIATGKFPSEPCTSLAGGVLAMDELPHLEAATDGSAVVIGSAEAGAVIWHKTDAPGCEWTSVAEIDHVDAVVLAPRLAGADGPTRSVAARAEQGEDRSRVLIWTLTRDGLLDVQQVIQQSGRRFDVVAFVDDRHLAVTSTAIAEPGAAAEDRVYLLDRMRPDVYLSIPVEFFAEGRSLRGVAALAPATDAAGPALLVTAQHASGGLELIRLRIASEAWATFASEPAAEQLQAVEFGVEGTMVSLTPAQLETEILAEMKSLTGMSITPSAVLYSAGVELRPGELWLLELASGERRRLTDNWIHDYLPRLASDGSHATFASLMLVNLSANPFSVPRVLALEPQK